MAASPASDHAAEHGLGHVLPVKTLAATFAALVALTLLTVFTGKMDLHGFDLAVALIIATIKATLVALIFMHLRWDRPFNGLVFLITILFVGMFLALTVTDRSQYERDIHRFDRAHPAEAPTGE
ncbi:MAG: hypothetical protein D6702_02340 [Planctomycetota bacterium]|nr:MAG: hypothetical protein D6702_02340 [Planctomycetota bacterium]